MRDRLTSLIAIALLVTLCAMSYWYSVKAELENVTHLSDLNSPDFIARDITITQFDDDGIAKAKVFAKEVEIAICMASRVRDAGSGTEFNA